MGAIEGYVHNGSISTSFARGVDKKGRWSNRAGEKKACGGSEN